MDKEMSNIEWILQQVRDGTLSVKDAKALLHSYEDLGFVKIDHYRQNRTGFPEVVYGEGKPPEQIIRILESLMKSNRRVLATRIDQEKAARILAALPDFKYDPVSRTVSWKHREEPEILYGGYIAVVCAGTSDLPVAEEAAITAGVFGCRVERVYDVGVAGIHRLFQHLETIQQAVATVVVAGMEGALASVVAGLVSNPVIAVPTSVGYGANFHGLSALLSMLNACAPGVSVVNIDNGFGAGYIAALINRSIAKNNTVR